MLLEIKSIAGKIRLLAILLSSWSSILPVPLNSSKITSSILDPVSVNAVAIIDSDPPPSMFLAAPKNLLGLWSALASTPPLNILPLAGWTVLYALARRVMESSRITTSCPHSTKRFAFSKTIFATLTCSFASLSKVEAITSPFTFRCISVTSSGLSSIRRIIWYTSGWFAAIALATSLSNIVLPVFGWDTIIPLCPLPIGAKRSIILVDIVLCLSANLNFSWGNNGVKCSKATLSLTTWGSSPFILLTLIKGKYFSPSFGGRTCPKTVSPVLSPKSLICDCDT